MTQYARTWTSIQGNRITCMSSYSVAWRVVLIIILFLISAYVDVQDGGQIQTKGGFNAYVR